MENPSKIIVFGDSIAKGVCAVLKKEIQSKFEQDHFDISVVNAGVSGETTSEALTRIEEIVACHYTVAIINLGMNDWRKNNGPDEFRSNLSAIVQSFLDKGTRVILNTINPDHNGTTYRFSQDNRKGESPEIPAYNKIIKEISTEKKTRIADVYSYWKKFFPNTYLGLEDAIHPNRDGYKLLVKAIMPVLIRTENLILWQFNGRYAHCNYSCPYCYVPTSVNKGLHFNHTIEKWEAAFNKHFGDKKTVFYFSYGEPLIVGQFYEVLEMVGRNKNWEAKTTSNLSVPLDRLLNSSVAKSGRLNVNASFHPSQTSIDDFIEKLDTLRTTGIEPSVVYVMYPPQIDAFEPEYMPKLRDNGYVVHIRAFRGLHRGRKYPGAYSLDEWKKTAKYMDRANLRYQLGEVSGLGRLTCIGMTHILVDNTGKIEMCDSYVGDRAYGNIFDQRLNLDLEPKPFPGLVPLAAVDDIADYVELEYKDLTGNNVLNYARQGGVYKKANGEIIYPFENTDFSDKGIGDQMLRVPDPFMSTSSFWLNARWFYKHFIYSYLIKKYGKYLWAAVRGKWRLLKQGKLKFNKDFWHS